MHKKLLFNTRLVRFEFHEYQWVIYSKIMLGVYFPYKFENLVSQDKEEHHSQSGDAVIAKDSTATVKTRKK